MKTKGTFLSIAVSLIGLLGFHYGKQRADARPRGKAAIRRLIRHYLNSAHLYCRLRDIGIPKGTALSIATRWLEPITAKFLYGGAR